MTDQLRLSFEHQPASGAEDFMPAPCNDEAVAWLARWPEWPAPALLLYGPPGCGKSHLARIWATRTGAYWLDRAVPKDIPWSVSNACVLDDADPVADEVALLSLYRRLQEANGHLLMTAQRPPSQWRLRLPDLASRLRAAPAVAIGSPDDALLGAVLLKLFADRQLAVGQAVIQYLVRHMERSFDAAQRVVAKLDAASLDQQRPITVALARTILEPAIAQP